MTGGMNAGGIAEASSSARPCGVYQEPGPASTSGGTGFVHLSRFMSEAEIQLALEATREIERDAPFARPRMPGERGVFHLELTNCGSLGWWADDRGYRYVDRHPVTKRPFPCIPTCLLAICQRALRHCQLEMRIDSLLINRYPPGGSLGMHIDSTEPCRHAPIVSLSVGADALFLLGGPGRKDPTSKYVLSSGDCCLQSGRSRNYFHGVKKIFPTMGNPVADGGRLNFTFRQVMA